MDERKPEMTLKFKRNIPLVFSLVAFLLSVALVFGDQPIVAYIFN